MKNVRAKTTDVARKTQEESEPPVKFKWSVKMKSRKSLKLNYWKWRSSKCNCSINALKLAYFAGHILAHITSSRNWDFVVPLYIHGLGNLLDLKFSLRKYSWELVLTTRISVNFQLKRYYMYWNMFLKLCWILQLLNCFRQFKTDISLVDQCIEEGNSDLWKAIALQDMSKAQKVQSNLAMAISARKGVSEKLETLVKKKKWNCYFNLLLQLGAIVYSKAKCYIEKESWILR